MKKFFTLIAVCAMTLAANAQIVSSSSRKITTEVGEFPNYNRLYISYSPMSFSTSGDWDSDDWTASGVALGWLGGWSVSKTMPLYVEAGLNLRYNHWSDDWNDYDEWGKHSKTFLSASIPVNVSYKYAIPGVDGLSVAPYLGLHLTGNIIGKEKEEWGYGNKSEEDDGSFFDEDYMGKDNTANRLQFGWQVGVGANYKKLYFGVGYSAEFTEYIKNVNTGGLTLTLGLNF